LELALGGGLPGGSEWLGGLLPDVALNFGQHDLHRHSTAKPPSALLLRTTRHPSVLRKGLDSISVSGAFTEQSQHRMKSSSMLHSV
jgi:hypothetical protein